MRTLGIEPLPLVKNVQLKEKKAVSANVARIATPCCPRLLDDANPWERSYQPAAA